MGFLLYFNFKASYEYFKMYKQIYNFQILIKRFIIKI